MQAYLQADLLAYLLADLLDLQADLLDLLADFIGLTVIHLLL